MVASSRECPKESAKTPLTFARQAAQSRLPAVSLGKCVRSVHHAQIWANSEQMALLLQALVSSRSIPTGQIGT